MSDTAQRKHLVALAAEQALRPSARDKAARLHGAQPLRELIATALLVDRGGYPDVWWQASGKQTTTALDTLLGIGEEWAELFVRAALHAVLLTHQDPTTANVLTLAERAHTWHQGAHYGATAAAH